MKRIIGLGIGGLLALVIGLVLPHLPDSSKAYGSSTFQRTAANCSHPAMLGIRVPSPGATRLFQWCARASDVMNLGAWLVVLGALVLVVAVVVLMVGRLHRRPALRAHAI